MQDDSQANAPSPVIRSVSGGEVLDRLDGLCALLAATVDGGGSIGFLAPMTSATAEAFWREVAAEMARDARVMVAAQAEGRIIGSVQLSLALPPNQPHRADVTKLMVTPEARGRGVGERLVRAVEAEALARGRWLLTLDTVTDEAADRLYRRCGWTPAGDIPDYALTPHGALIATRHFLSVCDSPARPTTRGLVVSSTIRWSGGRSRQGGNAGGGGKSGLHGDKAAGNARPE